MFSLPQFLAAPLFTKLFYCIVHLSPQKNETADVSSETICMCFAEKRPKGGQVTANLMLAEIITQ